MASLYLDEIRGDGQEEDGQVILNGNEAFRHAINSDPSNLALRGVYADWLEERGDPMADVQRWMFTTGHRPIYMPVSQQTIDAIKASNEKVGTYQGWFVENSCSAQEYTLPKAAFEAIKETKTFRVSSNRGPRTHFAQIYCPKGDELDRALLEAFPKLGAYSEPNGDYATAPLRMTYESRVLGAYNHQNERTAVTIDEMINVIRGNRSGGRMFIEVGLGHWHIPMVDIDNADTTDVDAFIKQNDLGYIKYQSSPGKYWYFLDIGCNNFYGAFAGMRHLKNNDPLYVSYCYRGQQFHVRAELRQTNFKPTMISQDVRSPLLKRFSELFQQHWGDPRLLEILRLRGGI